MNAIAPPSGAPASGPALDNRRVLAGLIDLAVIAAGVFVLATLFSMVNGTDLTVGPPIVVIALLWGLYYYFALESGDGQTLGKKVMKLRVVRADGGTTSMRDVAVRTVVRLLDFPMMYLVGLVTMMVTKEKRQRLGDIAAGTLVVDASVTPAPASSAAVAAVAAPAAPDAPVEERPADAPPLGEPSFPVAKSPVDVGAPIDGMNAPERPDVPQVSSFDPFAEQADEPQAEDPEVEEPQVQVLSDVQAPDPVVEPTPEPPVEPTPEPPVEPSHEPVVEVTPEPMDAPPVEPPVQAYPSEPAPEEPTFEEAPSEPASFEPAPEEPAAEPAPEEPVVEPAAEQPSFGHAPAEPAPADEPVAEPAAEEPSLEPAPADEPAADQSFSGPAADVPSDAPASNGDSAAEGEDQVTVKSVETVSAMDLIMGDDDESPSKQDDGPAGA